MSLNLLGGTVDQYLALSADDEAVKRQQAIKAALEWASYYFCISAQFSIIYLDGKSTASISLISS